MPQKLGFGTVCNTVPSSQTALHKASGPRNQDFLPFVDWVTLRCLVPELGQAESILALIAAVFRDSFEIKSGPIKVPAHKATYDFMGESAKGIRAYWYAPGNGLKSHSGVATLRLEFSGSVCASIAPVDFRDLLRLLVANGQAVASRFDIAYDDFSKSLWAWDDLEAAARAGNFSGPQRRQKIDDYEDGITYYFGTRKSEAMYRFYDKAAQSGGLIDANRIELELKRSKANQALLAWLAPPAGEEIQAAKILAEFLTGNIDFIDRGQGDKNLDRCPRLGWWQVMIDTLGQGVRLLPLRESPTIEKTMEWLINKVGPSLHMINRVLTDQKSFQQFLKSVLDAGKENQNSRHDKLVLAAQLSGWA